MKNQGDHTRFNKNNYIGSDQHRANGLIGLKAGNETQSKLKCIRIEEYNQIPNKCQQCCIPLNYKKRANKFCSQSCAAITSNARLYPKIEDKRKCEICQSDIGGTHKSRKICDQHTKKEIYRFKNPCKGNINKKRSKDEIKLFDLCSTTFYCLPNHKIADGWDADIVIPDLKIAILWNGPWHYKEMNFKNHSLLQVQTRDRIKTKLFTNLGWKVIVYEDRHFTPQKAFEDLVANVGIEPTHDGV